MFLFLHTEALAPCKLFSSFPRPYFSLSEPQHLRKTHHRPQHDDVIRQVPTAFEPVYRWQCGTLKIPHEPCQPSSPQTVAHSHRVHEVTGSLLLLIHVYFSCCFFFFHFFCFSLCRLRFAHRRKGGKSECWIGSYRVRFDVNHLPISRGLT